MKHCQDCGCKVYGGACVNCHEEIYIEKQYVDLEECVPTSIEEAATKHRIAIEKERLRE